MAIKDVRKLEQCKGCERLMRDGSCAVLNPKPESCWAYTTDPDWEEKVAKQVREYVAGYAGGAYKVKRCISCRYAKRDGHMSDDIWTAYQCTNPDSAHHGQLLNVSPDGMPQKRISWKGCNLWESRATNDSKDVSA